MKIGQQGYELRRKTADSWLNIANSLSYGQHLPRRLRGQRICLLARSHAENYQLKWPVVVKQPDHDKLCDDEISK